VVDSRAFYEADVKILKPLTADGADADYAAVSRNAWEVAVDGAEYKCATVTAVSQVGGGQFAVINSNETIVADFVVSATGFMTPLIKPTLGATWDERKREITDLRGSLKTAKHVIIGGNGVVGVEMAGSVRLAIDTASGAKVHLVGPGALLLNDTYGEGDRKLLTDYVRSQPGVILHNDKVVTDSTTAHVGATKTYTLASGATIDAEVYIPCFATFITGKYLAGIDGAVNAAGMVIVDHATLEAKAAKGLFAVGCSDIVHAEKVIMAPKLEGQAATVGKNIWNTINHRPLERHVEGATFMQHAPYVNFGDGHWSMLMTDKCGIPGKCVRCCGFPFPCLLGFPCFGCVCGMQPCGWTGMRPAGQYVSKCFECIGPNGAPALRMSKNYDLEKLKTAYVEGNGVNGPPSTNRTVTAQPRSKSVTPV
jgi:hypothetical protein